MTADPTTHGEPDTIVRALFTSVRVPGLAAPYDTVHAKVHYPARPTGSDTERLTGQIPPDAERQPYPIVLLCNGINVGPEAYGWLAQRLAEDGACVVTYSLVGELFPGQYGLTPGLDIAAVTPDTYGTRPSTPVVEPLLDALAALDAGDGPLSGALDLTRCALLGHSAGGTVVLHNSNADYFPALRAGVAYAAHTIAATQLGWDPGTVLPCTGSVPLLLLGGTNDGVMQRSSDRYGPDGHRADPLTMTFEAGVGDDRIGYLGIVDGANHFAVGHPEDPTVARGFLDLEPTSDPTETRAFLGDVIAAFLARYLHDRDDRDTFTGLLASDRFATARRTPAATADLQV